MRKHFHTIESMYLLELNFNHSQNCKLQEEPAAPATPAEPKVDQEESIWERDEELHEEYKENHINVYKIYRHLIL